MLLPDKLGLFPKYICGSNRRPFLFLVSFVTFLGILLSLLSLNFLRFKVTVATAEQLVAITKAAKTSKSLIHEGLLFLEDFPCTWCMKMSLRKTSDMRKTTNVKAAIMALQINPSWVIPTDDLFFVLSSIFTTRGGLFSTSNAEMGNPCSWVTKILSLKFVSSVVGSWSIGKIGVSMLISCTCFAQYISCMLVGCQFAVLFFEDISFRMLMKGVIPDPPAIKTKLEYLVEQLLIVLKTIYK